MNDEVRLLFHELADLARHERKRVLNERHLDREVRSEVESLLNFDSANDGNFTACVAGVADGLLGSSAGRQAGFCGSYRLVRLLGRGGMGSVYLGERTDGEIQQKVAVKLLSAEGGRPGWRERFLKERQLLASLSHPSIVHVIDAGRTEDGRPYLVMEYVDGAPIDIYCAQLSLRDRLILFLSVCDGISHAHKHLIIHRDLKPSNIFVDGSGHPKVLDFGIAKLLDENGEKTQTIERLLTPSYASPEQLSGAIQTAATDIYSLGAVLYKLLTGRSPNDSGADAVPAASRPNANLPSDLGYILRKALRDEPEERYASVEAFGNDIRAFLQSRPVAARSGNAWYRTRKFLRRYWLPVATAALVVASLAIGLYVANRERLIAERRFAQLQQLSDRVFDLDKAIKDIPGSIQARQRLVAASLQYLEGLASEVHGDLDLTRELGIGYWRIARLQGVPVDLNLGEPGQAEINLRKANELLTRVLAARPNDRAALFRSAAVMHDRMILAQEAHQSAEAEAYGRQAGDRLDRFLRQGKLSGSERIEAAGLYTNIALANVNMHLYPQAISAGLRAVNVVGSLPAARFRVAEALSVIANAQRYQGQLTAALQTIRDARKASETAVYSSETARAFSLYGPLLREGLILGEDGGVNLDRQAEAIEPLRKALDIVENIARKDRSDAASRLRVGNAGNFLGEILAHTDPQSALAVYDLALRRLGEIHPSVAVRRDEARLMVNSSYALRRLGRNLEAKQRIDTALATLAATKDYPAERVHLDSEVYVALLALADYAAQRDMPKGLEAYEQLLDKVIASKPDVLTDLRNAPKMSELYATIARLYRQTGEIGKSQKIEARRLELWRKWDQKLPNNPFVQRQLALASQ